MKKIEIPTLETLPEAAREFLSMLDDRTVIAFRGPMGAGKTTFIAELCRQLGVEEPVSSPSFAIINEYRSEETAELIYHFDFYRLEKPGEAEDIGAPDYFDSGALCLIEWPEWVDSLLPGDTRFIDVRVNADGSRTLLVED